MYPTLIHIYGPFSIHSYGAMIALGLLVFSALFLIDRRRSKLINTDLFCTLLIRAIIAAVIGGKLLFALANWNLFENSFEVLEFWHGGFSILGSMLGVICVIPWYLKSISLINGKFLTLWLCTRRYSKALHASGAFWAVAALG